MASITLGGDTINTVGSLPAVGSKAPDFLLTKNDLSDVKLSDYSGKKVILNIFPSLDTGVCADSVRKFNNEASKLDNTEVLCISADLPFAHGRFCEAEGIEKVTTLSDLRNKDFGDKYGVLITDGVLAGVMSRAIVVLDESGTVLYTEQVPEIKQEPNYDAALGALS
ncbi:thiol peroxidase [candidate division KSB1 bacterium]|nr:thiol peroxidase [candidate division KSB1 bacterium]